jgi:hypothetical protein
VSEEKNSNRDKSIRQKIHQLEAKMKADTTQLERLYCSLMWDDQIDPERGDLSRPNGET